MNDPSSGFPFDMGQLLEAARGLQQKLAQAQERLSRVTVEGEAGGGLVKVTATGRLEVLSVRIDPSLLEPSELEMLQDLVAAATNVALRKARDAAQSELGGLDPSQLTSLL
jgi:hypothetical protein